MTAVEPDLLRDCQMRNFTFTLRDPYVAFPEESVAGASPFSEAIAAAVMLSNGFTLLYRPEDRLRWGFFSAMMSFLGLFTLTVDASVPYTVCK